MVGRFLIIFSGFFRVLGHFLGGNHQIFDRFFRRFDDFFDLFSFAEFFLFFSKFFLCDIRELFFLFFKMRFARRIPKILQIGADPADKTSSQSGRKGVSARECPP